jgi:hypothetical protein
MNQERPPERIYINVNAIYYYFMAGEKSNTLHCYSVGDL